MKPFKGKLYVLIQAGTRVYWHSTFGMFCACKENEFVFYSKEQAIVLKNMTSDVMDMYEVSNFTLKKVTKI